MSYAPSSHSNATGDPRHDHRQLNLPQLAANTSGPTRHYQQPPVGTYNTSVPRSNASSHPYSNDRTQVQPYTAKYPQAQNVPHVCMKPFVRFLFDFASSVYIKLTSWQCACGPWSGKCRHRLARRECPWTDLRKGSSAIRCDLIRWQCAFFFAAGSLYRLSEVDETEYFFGIYFTS